MNVLVFGSNGFIGKNLIYRLKESGHTPITFSHRDDIKLLPPLIANAQYIVIASGVSRNQSGNDDDFILGNVTYLTNILSIIKNKPFVYISTLKINEDSPYGRSKLLAEQLIKQHQIDYQCGHILRLTNVFGKWAQPFHNSVIATFCHSLNYNIPLNINENSGLISFVYIDRVISVILNFISGINKDYVLDIKGDYQIDVIKLASILNKMHQNEFNFADNINPTFLKQLYATYMAYKNPDHLFTLTKGFKDARGSFTELFHFFGQGQVSLNVAKPLIVKGGHYHHTKHEKFLLLSGKLLVRLRAIDNNKIYNYVLSRRQMGYLDIPPGYTHDIKTLSKRSSKVLMWANELYDKDNPDTYVMKVDL